MKKQKAVLSIAFVSALLLMGQITITYPRWSTTLAERTLLNIEEAQWIELQSTSALSGLAHSMIQMDMDKDQTVWANANGLFVDVTGDFNFATHLNLSSAATSAVGSAYGVHGPSQYAIGMDIDDTNNTATGIKLAQGGTNGNANQILIDFSAEEDFITGSYGGSFTGRFVQMAVRDVLKHYIDYTGRGYFDNGTLFPDNAIADFGTGLDARLAYNNVITPDAFWVGTSTDSNAVHIAEAADVFDWNNGPCAAAVCTNPQLIVHDKDQNTTNYQSVGLSGVSGRFVKTLTDGVATEVVRIPIAAATSGTGWFEYAVHAKDATNTQTRTGRVLISLVAEGTTETCVLGTVEELDNTPTGTLTAAITCDATVGANVVGIMINAASSLTETTLEAYGNLTWVGAGEPLPQ